MKGISKQLKTTGTDDEVINQILKRCGLPQTPENRIFCYVSLMKNIEMYKTHKGFSDIFASPALWPRLVKRLERDLKKIKTVTKKKRNRYLNRRNVRLLSILGLVLVVTIIITAYVVHNAVQEKEQESNSRSNAEHKKNMDGKEEELKRKIREIEKLQNELSVEKDKVSRGKEEFGLKELDFKNQLERLEKEVKSAKENLESVEASSKRWEEMAGKRSGKITELSQENSTLTGNNKDLKVKVEKLKKDVGERNKCIQSINEGVTKNRRGFNMGSLMSDFSFLQVLVSGSKK